MESTKGTVKIADDVIANIASTAALEVEGVQGMVKDFTKSVVGRLSHKKITKGVTLQVESDKVKVSVAIVVESGVKMQEVAKDVQQKVKNAIETMTGFTAECVNVHIAGQGL